ncbi:hypothetical protein QAD02_023339 [Eretmocerus hayati]|uniref:Uncharacterized protein n=1 Tax=Eretmocerus hayati TaxID=131215 RepID=A0ACC2PVU9_9HYME|nr:hypothetical protein QAD02_023339 [Eretmocerus hayati]
MNLSPLTRLLFLYSILYAITIIGAESDAVTWARTDHEETVTIDPLLSTNEIVNDVDPAKYPYLVSVMVYENKPKDTRGPILLTHSAGVLISSNYVLDTKPDIQCNECRYTVRIWSDEEGTIVSEHKVDLIEHENYTKSGNSDLTSPNSVVLYKFKKPIKFGRRAQPANLPRSDTNITSGDQGTLIDWSTTENYSRIVDSRVKEKNILMIDRQGCNELLERANHILKFDNLHELPKGFFCAKSKIYCEECLEDWSSKLFVGDQLVGLSNKAVSMFIGDRYFLVSVFIDVAHYRNWIKNYIDV